MTTAPLPAPPRGREVTSAELSAPPLGEAGEGAAEGRGGVLSICYLSLGSNQGEREELLRAAIAALDEVGTVEQVSDFLETEPVGYQSPHLYLNAALRMRTTLTPLELLDATQAIERRLGRTVKTGDDGVYHDRPIDIDLLLYDHVRLSTPRLTLPHPRMAERQFVMIPLSQVLVP